MQSFLEKEHIATIKYANIEHFSLEEHLPVIFWVTRKNLFAVIFKIWYKRDTEAMGWLAQLCDIW